MLTTRDEIHMVKKEIDRKKEELSLLDTKDPNNRFKYANAVSELRILNKKYDELTAKIQEEYKKGTNIPIVGDDRYESFPHKASLDHLRIKHFALYKKEPTIYYCGGGKVLEDCSLSKYADSYKVSSVIPFKLVYSSTDIRLAQDERASLGVKINRDDFDTIGDKDIELLTSFIEYYTKNKINFIMTDKFLKEIFFAFISKKEFSYIVKREKDYYAFFNDLCENVLRNFVYLGDSLEEGASKKSINQAKENLLFKEKKGIAKANGISQEKLNNENEIIKKKILRIT